VESYEPVLVAARADRELLTQNQMIRREQDAAYLEALQKDKEKVVPAINKNILSIQAVFPNLYACVTLQKGNIICGVL